MSYSTKLSIDLKTMPSKAKVFSFERGKATLGTFRWTFFEETIKLEPNLHISSHNPVARLAFLQKIVEIQCVKTFRSSVGDECPVLIRLEVINQFFIAYFIPCQSIPALDDFSCRSCQSQFALRLWKHILYLDHRECLKLPTREVPFGS